MAGKSKKVTAVKTAYRPIPYGFRETIREALNLRGISTGRTRRPEGLFPSSARYEIAEVLKNVGIEALNNLKQLLSVCGFTYRFFRTTSLETTYDSKCFTSIFQEILTPST
jgi:hypothetical protein